MNPSIESLVLESESAPSTTMAKKLVEVFKRMARTKEFAELYWKSMPTDFQAKLTPAQLVDKERLSDEEIEEWVTDYGDYISVLVMLPFLDWRDSGQEMFYFIGKTIDEFVTPRKWFVLMRGKSSMNWVIAPSYGRRVTKLPERLYHVTWLSRVDRVLARGLTPRMYTKRTGHVDRQYKPRVYLALSLQDAETMRMAFAGVDEYEGDYGSYYALTVVTVVVSKLPKSIKFYVDPEEPKRSIWTPSHIPASALELEDEFAKEYQQWKRVQDEDGMETSV